MGIDDGLTAWRFSSNHNRMLELQDAAPKDGPVELAFFASSAFRITTPAGITVMLDPWRNHPTGYWNWYFKDFPLTKVDIGVATHAHYDHDALNRLDASVLLDRPIGRYEVGDLAIRTIPDKHATDASYGTYDFNKINSYFNKQVLDPPNNCRSWDNNLVVVETGGLRILHWGDNRHNPPEDVWKRLGEIDILLMPVDDSQHVMGHPMVASVLERLAPKVVVPHHYYSWKVVQRQSTLLPVEKWLEGQPRVRRLEAATTTYTRETLPAETTVDYFGDNIAFDVDAWYRDDEVWD
ncbi:hypothetical protein LNKW23_32260 [Paralimibaculum aggregatum]|uniref:MBL fold metallo-hydrolase n=1 Tax=Paralimibaculum aggregatum TaxID=3036245 RepID=A0ABQ6LM35_9RHOB|nr:MBL fold metallo-hydrolase [Limibaculum sp. NKW23]GMG84012.1 hypothetical protein LNKW23_32260 [Limibaculum sp. NKW23]